MGLLEAITIKVGSWTHLQKLDYEQLPFKCRKCHVYGHFTRDCPTNNDPAQGKEDGWNQVKRSKSHPKNQKSGGPNDKGPHQTTAHQIPTKTVLENKFDPLSSQTEGTQEIELQKETEMTQETEVHKTAPSGKGTPSSSLKGANTEDPKDKILEEEEEEQESEES